MFRTLFPTHCIANRLAGWSGHLDGLFDSMLRACLGRSSGASVRAETFAPSLPHGFPPFLQARFTSSNAGTASCVLRKPLCAVKAGPRDDRGGRPVMSGHDAELHLNAETSRKRKMQTPAESPAAPSNPAKLQVSSALCTDTSNKRSAGLLVGGCCLVGSHLWSYVV